MYTWACGGGGGGGAATGLAEPLRQTQPAPPSAENSATAAMIFQRDILFLSPGVMGPVPALVVSNPTCGYRDAAMRPFAIVLALLVSVPLASISSGCSAKRRQEKAAEQSRSTLEEAARAYNDAVRWGRLEKAVEFIAQGEREAFLVAEARQAKLLRVTDIRIGRIELPPGSSEATVPVTRTFYRTDDLREQTETVMQSWNLQGERWFVVWRAPVTPVTPPGNP